MAQKKAKRKKKHGVTREIVDKALEKDPSGRLLAKIMIDAGIAASVESTDEFRPLPNLG